MKGGSQGIKGTKEKGAFGKYRGDITQDREKTSGQGKRDFNLVKVDGCVKMLQGIKQDKSDVGFSN
jgi:hypothetical protein